jgi:hypothetical protein
MNSVTYEPMFMLAILPVAAMGAIASVIDDDAARWINGASKDQSPVSLAAPSNQSPMSPKKSAFTLSVNTSKKDNSIHGSL